MMIKKVGVGFAGFRKLSDLCSAKDKKLFDMT